MRRPVTPIESHPRYEAERPERGGPQPPDFVSWLLREYREGRWEELQAQACEQERRGGRG